MVFICLACNNLDICIPIMGAMESHEEWRDLKEEEIKIRRGGRSENVDHNSNCHLFTSLNCSKSYTNYQKKIVNAATMNDFKFTQYFHKTQHRNIFNEIWKWSKKLIYEWNIAYLLMVYQSFIDNRNMKYHLMGWFQLFSLLNLDFDLDTRF